MNNIQSPRVDDAGIEAELRAKGKNGPTVTIEGINALIMEEVYYTHLPLTICVLTLRNGFTVTGESACADPANYDEAIGQRLARAQAINKVWPLEGYLLKQRLFDEQRPKHFDIDAIAAACHEVNRQYCLALGDASQPTWADAPEWQRESIRKGVLLHIANPDASPGASHASWLQEKLDTGWEFGPVKNPDIKQHPCIVPFEQLSQAQQGKDYIFRAVVHVMAGIPL